MSEDIKSILGAIGLFSFVIIIGASVEDITLVFVFYLYMKEWKRSENG